jgi:hypothetical protein
VPPETSLTYVPTLGFVATPTSVGDVSNAQKRYSETEFVSVGVQLGPACDVLCDGELKTT